MAHVVLVVEDDEDTRELFAIALRGAGFEVHTASSATQAMASPLPRVDVAVLDYGMPGLTGADLARDLRSLTATASAKFVLVTGHGPEALKESAKKTHFDAMLKKPIAPDQLVRVVRHLLR